jgi:hypothetical protein
MTTSGKMTNHSITSMPEPEDVFLLRIAAILSPEITEITKKQRETKAVKKETRAAKHPSLTRAAKHPSFFQRTLLGSGTTWDEHRTNCRNLQD